LLLVAVVVVIMKYWSHTMNLYACDNLVIVLYDCSRRRSTLDGKIPSASSEALHLLKQLLLWNPGKRLTAEQAMTHPYVAR
jgi:serine/threonine protein kinase